MQSVVGVEAQVGDQQVRHGLADVLSRRDEITACCDISDWFEYALQSHPATNVGFDDQNSSCHVNV
jgi:hypothetical protein